MLLDSLTSETLSLSHPALGDLNRRDATAPLLGAAHRASGEERSRLEEQVVQLNMSVARDLARRYRGRGVPLEDLQQVAYLGLVKAVKAFDPDKASDLLSFAVPTIRGELRRYFRDFGWVVRPPRAIQELQARITGAESELCQLLGRSPRPSEIASRLDVELNQVLDALGANGCFAPSSLDYPDGDDGDVGIGPRLGQDDPGFAGAEARAALQKIMRELDDRERMIIEMRFFRGCTQAEIGKEVGVTQMQVSRLIAGLLARFREQIGQTAA